MLSKLEKSMLCCTLLHVLYTETEFSSQKQPEVPKIQSEEIRFFSNILEVYFFPLSYQLLCLRRERGST